MTETVIKIENVKKRYRLGSIGGGTLTADIQSRWAKIRGKEDPNTQIGTDQSKAGSTFYALDGINLEVKRGEALGIIGANGAGKSTLLKLLCRVTAPTEGTIRMKGRIASMLEVGTGFHPELTGRENIYMNGAILGMTKQEIDSKIEEIIDFSECRKFIDTPVKRYSSGMYVKLAFAVAAHLDAEIMIMDEVLAVGDMKFQEKCLGKMGDESGSNGKTVLYVSHNMNTIRQLCTRCIVLKEGKIIFDGDTERAIDVYLDNNMSDCCSSYELETVKRPSIEHGSKVWVTSFEWLDKRNAVFLNTERVMFRIRWKANEHIKDLRLYYAICFKDDTPVGMMQSDVFGEGVPGAEKTATFELDFSNLVEGVYYFYIDVFSMNSFSSHYSYDHPLQKVFFEIVKDENVTSVNWIRRAWGSVRLNPIKQIMIEKNDG